MADESLHRGLAEPPASALARLLARWRRRHAESVAAVRDMAVPPPDLPPVVLTVRQWLWGPGFVIPGDAAHMLSLVCPLGLAPATTLLDVSAGLGGPARAVARAFDATVIGLERDPDQARMGMAFARAEGLAKRAPVSVYDPEGFELPPQRYDGVIAREAVYTVRDKERFLRVLMQGLKPQGALVLAEFVLDRTAGDRLGLANWAPLPAYPPYLWTRERYVDCLKALGFTVRRADDMTAAYRAMMIAGWTRLAHRADLRTLPRTHFAPVIDEAERAMRTVEALDSGILKIVRITAAARAGHS